VPGRVDGRVALLTGAARGQGRADAVRLAEEGAAVVVLDLCGPIEGVPYPLPNEADLDETRAAVEQVGGSALAVVADVRDQRALDAAVAATLSRFGRLDIVVANAGISPTSAPVSEVTESAWQTVIDIDLSGVWHTVKAATPALVEAGRGGSIVIVSSVAGLKGFGNVAPYIASKHGAIGLMKAVAIELAPHGIRCNAVLPTNVDTPMIINDATFRLFRPDLEAPTLDDVIPRLIGLNTLSIPWVEAVDVANAVLWLASDEARYVTGVALPIDAGALLK
jgi:(+)-trans-carveol dehydrogenase